MSRQQRWALHLGLALTIASFSLILALWQSGVAQASTVATPGPNDCGSCTGTYYGANSNEIAKALQKIWPQANGPYCAIATAEGVINYDDEKWGIGLRFTSVTNQTAIGKDNQHSGASEWGYATPLNEAAGITNIAPDQGVDPRSAAYIQTHWTNVGHLIFHNYIYRWQFAHQYEPGFRGQATEATTSLAQNLEAFREPLSVIVNGGMHSLLVAGIWSANDPATHYPAGIQGLVYHDPMFSQADSRYEVDIDTWTTNGLNDAGNYTLWSRYYGVTAGGSVNTADPEPTIGPYTPTKSAPDHWYQGFSWITRDQILDDARYGPDWAFTMFGQRLISP